ncbi:hypothetical protein ACX3VG_16205, partial [Escherichia coli]
SSLVGSEMCIRDRYNNFYLALKLNNVICHRELFVNNYSERAATLFDWYQADEIPIIAAFGASSPPS